MRWILFPPVISLLLLAPTALLHNRESAVRVPPVIWGAVIAAYICFCCLSAFFISKKDGTHSTAVSFLSQGLLLTVMALQSGSVLLSWIGLILFVIGLALSFFYATNGVESIREDTSSQHGNNDDVRERVDSLLSKLPLPVCVTDAKGIIVGSTPGFCEAAGVNAEEVQGEVISEVLPLDQDTVTFDSGKWWISQVKEGARYYFSLLPTQDCKPANQAEAAAPIQPRGIDVFDPETGLCVDEYRMVRGPQEISRSQRYKRSIAGILLELTFNPSMGIILSGEQQHMLFVAFASRVRQALRIPDCGFILPGERIQLLLPETPLAGAKTLLGRLVTLPQDVFDDAIRDAARPKVKAGIFFYNGTTKMEYNIFSAALEEDFIKSRDPSGSTISGEAA
jgi:PAS domain-containing protein